MMRPNHFPFLQRIRGFALVELMVITMIIGLLAIVAAPTIRTYRDKSRVASGLGSASAIQAALATYITTNDKALYPKTITSYDDLRTLVNAHGTTLHSSEQEMGLQFQAYNSIDSDDNGEYESYTLTLRVMGVATHRPGWCIVIQPSGVEKCTAM